MEEKIRVNISKRIYEFINKDAENFEFYKKDGSINKNAFINALVMNYYEDFENNKNIIFETIKKNSNHKLEDDEMDILTYKIMKDMNVSDTNKQKDTFINFRPTKETSYICEYIEHNLLKNISRSSYYRQMLESYFSLPQDKRECIIFKDKIDIIQKGIKEHKKVYILSKNNYLNNRPGFILHPYCISATKEELYNYVLGQLEENNLARTMRLCRIENVTLLNEKVNFDKECVDILKKMILYGPQYFYQKEEEEFVYVRLSKKGIDKFKSMYIHRPIPIKIENDTYIFACSYDQIFQYFSRFGSSAYIISPKSLQRQMQNFYKYAYYSYKNNTE